MKLMRQHMFNNYWVQCMLPIRKGWFIAIRVDHSYAKSYIHMHEYNTTNNYTNAQMSLPSIGIGYSLTKWTNVIIF